MKCALRENMKSATEWGIDPKKIVVSGVNKTHESMDRIMKAFGGKGIFTIESEEHYDILSKVCAEQQTDIKVIIRLSSGNQFGVDKDMFEHIASEIADDKHLELYRTSLLFRYAEEALQSGKGTCHA